MVDQSLAPRAGEFLIKGAGGADKFVNSNLDEGLKAKGIKTVIVTGTSAQGAVGGTTNGAAQRGYKAVVPVDGMSAEDAFNELYAVWHIYKGGPVNLASNATVTRQRSHHVRELNCRAQARSVLRREPEAAMQRRIRLPQSADVLVRLADVRPFDVRPFTARPNSAPWRRARCPRTSS